VHVVFLPEGEDPDDVVRRAGPHGMRELIAAKTDAEATLWRLALARHGNQGAEAVAALETELKDQAAKVQDPAMRSALQRAFKDRLYRMRGDAFKARRKHDEVARSRHQPRTKPLSEELRRKLGQGGARGPNAAAREAALVIALIHHPRLFQLFETDILDMHIEDEGLRRLLSKTINALVGQPDLDSEALRSQLSSCSSVIDTYQRWSADPLVKILRFTRQEASDQDAETGWRNALVIDRQQKQFSAEVAESGAEAHLDPGRERVWMDSVRLSLGAHTGDDNTSEGDA
jgi:DNA primase